MNEFIAVQAQSGWIIRSLLLNQSSLILHLTTPLGMCNATPIDPNPSGKVLGDYLLSHRSALGRRTCSTRRWLAPRDRRYDSTRLSRVRGPQCPRAARVHVARRRPAAAFTLRCSVLRRPKQRETQSEAAAGRGMTLFTKPQSDQRFRRSVARSWVGGYASSSSDSLLEIYICTSSSSRLTTPARAPHSKT